MSIGSNPVLLQRRRKSQSDNLMETLPQLTVAYSQTSKGLTQKKLQLLWKCLATMHPPKTRSLIDSQVYSMSRIPLRQLDRRRT